MTDRLRLFVAVSPGERARRWLRERQEAIRRAVSEAGFRASFPRVESLHLTLAFLGSVEAGRVPEIGAALEGALAGTDRFEIAFEGVGAFPPGGRPRVLWVGVGKGAEQLEALAERVVTGLEELGFERERRPFRPHLTVCRVKRARGTAARVLENVSPGGAVSSDVSEVVLYRSELHPAGAKHIPLVRVSLNA